VNSCEFAYLKYDLSVRTAVHKTFPIFGSSAAPAKQQVLFRAIKKNTTPKVYARGAQNSHKFRVGQHAADLFHTQQRKCLTPAYK
jgi:hypothetical protein